jgi:hypothetical protein
VRYPTGSARTCGRQCQKDERIPGLKREGDALRIESAFAGDFARPAAQCLGRDDVEQGTESMAAGFVFFGSDSAFRGAEKIFLRAGKQTGGVRRAIGEKRAREEEGARSR